MTKEAIIDAEVGDDPYLYRPDVLKVMDGYAKQQSIAFVDFIRLKSVADGSPKRLYIPDGNRYITEQLYELFLKQQDGK